MIPAVMRTELRAVGERRELIHKRRIPHWECEWWSLLFLLSAPGEVLN
jgi:hypothetical protein